ncbi:hypothetical protein BDQ17DRAFT_1368014 [Cyathus striatus]|nr:hypothetical protein BDQ17DRAFT_1368014 [Cyathus striatus]
MSISLGAFGLMSVPNPFPDLVAGAAPTPELRSIFCLVVFLIVSLVLAYLTNPSENTFRTYLTEQSFRQHLSRLDESTDDEHHLHISSHSSRLHSRSFDHPSPFHFANRASISLRTPKHVFHSFAIFTIAAMVPISKSTAPEDRDGWIISDSWYIGAFGRWWRGGVLETWYQDVIARTKDEESWSSGILSMKRLDMLDDSNVTTFTTKNLPPHLLTRGSPPRLRNRERSSQRSSMPPRSLTPPPLPKSASLPLHAARVPTCSAPIHPQHLLAPPSQPSISLDSRLAASSPSRSPSVILDQSPLVAEVLRQISSSKGSVIDLRGQLTECQTAASQSRNLLQQEVDTYRERKRQEDASKFELKSRTKVLDDSKRSAESTKKEAEKKLKSAQSIKDGANKRMEYLDNEIADLERRLHDDETFLLASQSNVSDCEQELSEALDHKRLEIKDAEDIIAALNQRSRELEDRLAEEKDRLRSLKDALEERKQQRVLHRLDSSSELWNSGTYGYSSHYTVEREHIESVSDLGNTVAGPASVGATLHGNPYSVYDDALTFGHGSSVLGIPDSEPTRPPALPILTPTSQSLLPTGIISSLDNIDGLPRSFQSESDIVLDKDWRGNASYLVQPTDNYSSGVPTVTASPTSIKGPSEIDSDHDVFEVNNTPGSDQRWELPAVENPIDIQRVSWLHRANSDSKPAAVDMEDTTFTLSNITGKPRRWFSVRDKPKKGLNPDAKEFNLARKPPNNNAATVSHPTYDALNPNGLGSTVLPTTSTSSSLLRAFAPSPEEREALQRALGGSTNTSFERLPSLSDVGSIPPSPSHVHAIPVVPHVSQHSAREMGKVLPSWLQSIPRIRKVNFSPWDDEEPTSTGENGQWKKLK